MHRVPLVKTVTVNYLVDVYQRHAPNLQSALEQSSLPYALAASQAEYVPQAAFGNLMQILHQHLGDERFFQILKSEAEAIVSHQLGLHNGSSDLSFLKGYSCFNRMRIETTAEGVWLNIDSENFFSNATLVTHQEELFTLFAVEAAINQLSRKQLKPKAYKVSRKDHQMLSGLQLPNNATLLIDRDCAGLCFTHEQQAELNDLVKTFEKSDLLSFGESVALALEGYIGRQNCSVDEFAEIVGTTPRTIQRKLKNEGTSYRKIKEQLNVKFAKRVLKQYDYSVDNIATQLGYSAASQFIRAFKRLTGATPLKWSKQQ